MNEKNKLEEVSAIEFNRCLSLLINKKLLEEHFYKYCILKIKKYIIKQFGYKVPVEETAYDVFHKKIFCCKTIPVIISPSKWLWAVTRHYVLDEFKSNRTYIRLIENIKYEPYYEDAIESEEVKAALKHLNEIQTQVIVLHYFNDFKYSDVAKVLHISTDYARKISQRAKEILKKYLT